MHVAAVRGNSLTAGLSPTGTRTEVFLAGCKMALSGHPCQGCFNSGLWDSTGWPEVTVDELCDDVLAENNKYVTIVGGEPLDQYEELVLLCGLLKENGCHIVLITHYTFEELCEDYQDILPYINVVIDGKYDCSKRIFDEVARPGVHQVIGSSNQRFFHKSEEEWREVNIIEGNLEEAYCG